MNAMVIQVLVIDQNIIKNTQQQTYPKIRLAHGSLVS